MGSTSPFSAEALAANRGGVLSADQRRRWQRYARRRRVGVMRAAFFLACISIVLFAFRGSASRPGELLTACAGLGAAAVILVIVAVAGRSAWTLDAGEGLVSIAEGAFRKDSSDPDLAVQTVSVGALRLNIGQSGYDAAPAAGYVRVFYLPRTKRIVNLERLPDRPLPAGPDAVRELLKDSLAGLRSGDRNAAGEARAALASIGEAVRAQFPSDPAPPPTGHRDPRSLAEALCGVWSNALMTLDFSADGTVTVTGGTVTGSTVRTGRWSVDRTGRLVADLGSGQAAADAWISGDGLTIKAAEGRGVTFRRGSAS